MVFSKKALGFMLSGIAFLVAGVIVGVSGDLPGAYHMVIEAVAAVCGILGIAFSAPKQ